MIYHCNNAFVQRIQNGHASSANGDLQMLGISADMRKQKSASPPLEAERASQNTESLTELAATESKLSSLAPVKKEFFDVMRHELRIPLNAIQNISKSLQEHAYGRLNQQQVEALSRVEANITQMLTLLDNMVDLSKIRDNKLQLNIMPVAVEALCQVCLHLVKDASQKKNLKVSATFDTYSMAATIQADQSRLKQIVLTLLLNAIKLTPEGKAIGLEVRADLASKMLHFSVWDSSIGIWLEEIKNLLQPLEQHDQDLSSHDSSIRLEMSLVQQLVELHSGSISVERSEGSGNRVTVSLPWQESRENRRDPFKMSRVSRTWSQDFVQNQPNTKRKVPNCVSWRPIHHRVAIKESSFTPATTTVSKKEHRESSVSDQSKPLILLAEDNEANISTLTEYLPAKGYRVIVARDGAQALQCAEQSHPDLILMDVHMPSMNGLEATRALRTNSSFINTPIIALTALAMRGDRERCLEAGANEYLSKPFSLKHLVAVIEKNLALTDSVVDYQIARR